MSGTLVVVLVLAAAAYGVYAYMGKRSDAKRIQTMAKEGEEHRQSKTWENKGA